MSASDLSDRLSTPDEGRGASRLSRRHLLRGAAAVGAGAVVLPVLGTGVAAAATGGFNVVTANITYSLSPAAFAADLSTATAQGHLIGLNEMWTRAELAGWAQANGFHCYHPYRADRPNAETNALLARASVFDVLGEDSVALTDTNGPDSDPRGVVLNWRRYVEKSTGVEIAHLHTHFTPHIAVDGHPGTDRGDRRVEDAFDCIYKVAVAAALFNQSGAEVIVTGDLNIDYTNDRRVSDPRFPFVALEQRGAQGALPGLRSCFTQFGSQGGTRNGRDIDYVYEWVRVPSRRRMKMAGYRMIDLTHSDHDAVIASFGTRSDAGWN